MATMVRQTQHSRPLAILSLSLFAAVVHSDPNVPCYDPTGTRAPGYYPCDPTAYIMTCCPQGWTCFRNSLCVVTTHSDAFPNLTLGEVVRGQCTNPLWANNICGDFCLDDADAKGEMAACGGDRFCCGHDFEEETCNCSPDGGAFTIKPGRAQTILAVSDASFTGSPTYVSPTRLHMSSTAQTTSSTPGKSTKTGYISISGSRRPSSSATSPTESSTTGRSSPSPSSSPLSTIAVPSPTRGTNQTGTDDGSGGGASKSLKIGLGVGIPLAALAIAGVILGYLLWYRRQRRERDGTVGWGTSDDLAENERADSPTLNRPAPLAMTQHRA